MLPLWRIHALLSLSSCLTEAAHNNFCARVKCLLQNRQNPYVQVSKLCTQGREKASYLYLKLAGIGGVRGGRRDLKSSDDVTSRMLPLWRIHALLSLSSCLTEAAHNNFCARVKCLLQNRQNPYVQVSKLCTQGREKASYLYLKLAAIVHPLHASLTWQPERTFVLRESGVLLP